MRTIIKTKIAVRTFLPRFFSGTYPDGTVGFESGAPDFWGTTIVGSVTWTGAGVGVIEASAGAAPIFKASPTFGLVSASKEA